MRFWLKMEARTQTCAIIIAQISQEVCKVAPIF